MDILNVTPLAEEDARRTLAPVGFTDWQAAYRSLRCLSASPDRAGSVNQFLPHLVQALSTCAGPDRVLVNLDRFMGHRSDPGEFLAFLAKNPRAIEILVTLFSSSQFMTEILLRNPTYFERLVEYRRLAMPKSVEQLYIEAQDAEATGLTPDEKLDALRRFQRWELLRIGACDLLDLYDLPAVTRQLSNLADCLIRACLKIAATQAGVESEILSVLGMGKLGGRELNYSSDIDLLFLTSNDPGSSQAALRVGEKLVDCLAHITAEGFLYRVDMRLRPWGKVGPLVSSLESFLTYLKKNARLWEKQALLKVRVVAGNPEVGKTFLRQARPLIFGASFEQLRSEVFGMKQRTEAQLRLNGRSWGEVKLGEGSIRDVEFTVQLLQLAFGMRHPEILAAGSLDALERLSAFRLLRVDDVRILTEGYTFLRTVEHHLQMMDYHQTHSLPQEPEAIAHLARRLGFRAEKPGEQFLARYQQHCSAIRSVFLRYAGSSEMNPTPDLTHNASAPATQPGVYRHIDRMAPSYSERFRPEEIARHAELAGQLDESHLVAVDALPLDNGIWQVTVVAYDAPGELALICGLMFVFSLNIISGDAFTYEPASEAPSRLSRKDAQRKIVDVFTVQPVSSRPISPDLWKRYAEELASFLHLMRTGHRTEAQIEMANRAATSLPAAGKASDSFVNTLYPIDIQIDNEASDRYTLLRISSQDTFGFLYEFTNGLALNHVYIARVIVDTTGSRVQDILYVTDEAGHKITNPARQQELRAATVLIKHFTHLLPLSPNPESALQHFGEFLADLFERPNWPEDFASLERPEVLDALARLLGVSDFLWDDFLRMQHANLFPVVQDVDGLSMAKSRAQLQVELEEALRPVHNGPQIPSEGAQWTDILNGFKDREMFRIDMRHILGQAHGHTREFGDFSSELTDLTEVVVNSAFHLCHEDLRLVYGTPRLENGEMSEMSGVGLGKFGGCELGYASDIELMFIYTGNGLTSGPEVITSTEFYEKLVQNFITAIRARREGIFEIDLQLRPYGKAGSLSVSLDSFQRYFGPNGPAWAYERQALVKLRPVAGNGPLGREITRLRDAFVYTGEVYNVTAMRAMRERQIRHLVKGGVFNPKFSLGGLVDVEYLVQGLQINYGHTAPVLRQTNTRLAMAALADAGFLPADDYIRLRRAHTFLRWLIDSLRVVRGNAKDVTLPRETSEEFAFLARRMNYDSDTARLASELLRYTEDVREINSRLLS